MKQGIHNLEEEKMGYIMKKKLVKPQDTKDYCLFIQKFEESLQEKKEKWIELGTEVRSEGQELNTLNKNLKVLIERMR